MNSDALYFVLVLCLVTGLYDGYKKTQIAGRRRKVFSKNIIEFLLPTHE